MQCGFLLASFAMLASCKKATPEAVDEPEAAPAAARHRRRSRRPRSSTPVAVATPMPRSARAAGHFLPRAKGVDHHRRRNHRPQAGQGAPAGRARQIRNKRPDGIELRDDQVTNNLRIARQFAAADAAAQASLRQSMQPPAPKPEATPVDYVVAGAPATPRPMGTSTTLSSGGSRLGPARDRGSRNVESPQRESGHSDAE